VAAREREVRVTILGDSTSAEKALRNVGDVSETEGSRLDRFGEKFGPKMVAAGAAAGAAGIYLTKLADEGKIAGAQLQTAIENAGGSMDQFAPRISNVSDRLIKLGFDDEATARSLATLTTATQDPTKALDSMGLAADIARSRHISLESAADKLAKAYSGNTKVFKEFGINLSANATEQERAAAIAELTARVHGQAAAQADNFSTKMESLKIRAENVAEAIGAKVGPALTVAGPLLAGVGGIVQSGLIPALISGVASAWSFAAGMVGAGLSAAAAAIPVMIAWAPVILGIAAIGAAAYLLYDNWSAVWGFIKDATVAAWDFIGGVISAGWDFVSGLVSGALDWIQGAFSSGWAAVRSITSTAWSWLTDTVFSGVSDVVSFVSTLPGRAAGAMSGLGGAIVNVAWGAMSWLWDAVSGGVSNVVGLVAGMPGRIVGALGYLGGYLWDAGYAIIDGFRRGIVAAAEAVYNFVRGIAGRIAALKGPLDYDRRLLVPAGNAIMDGLVAGLRDHEGRLVSQLAHTTGLISGVGGGINVGAMAATGGGSAGIAPAAAAGGTTVVVNVAGNVVTERDLVEAVQAGLLQKQRRVPTLGLS
jgi:hypothetical protein